MNKRQKKRVQKELARRAIDRYFEVLRLGVDSEYASLYVREILRIASAFTISLSAEEKLLFCKKCFVFHSVRTRRVRFVSALRVKEFRCLECGFVKRIGY